MGDDSVTVFLLKGQWAWPGFFVINELSTGNTNRLQMGQGIAVITGGGRGIGQALALELDKAGIVVLIVGRTAASLAETVGLSDGRMQSLTGDISDSKAREEIKEKLQHASIRYLVHNAAIVEPIVPLIEVNHEDLQRALDINLQAPLLLNQILYPLMQNGTRILNISTGCAHSALAGMGVYSITKAALHMAYQTYKQELLKEGIYVGSVMPGIVDTDMQAKLRHPEHKGSFASFEVFDEFKKSRQLLSAKESATMIADILMNMSDEQFIAKDWRVGDV